MADGPVLYVHVADDGGLLVVDGAEGRSAWVTEADLAHRVDAVVAAGGAVLLSQERGSALATPVVVAIEAAGARVVAARDVHPDAQRGNGGTSLMAASYVGALGLVDDLVARGAELDVQDESGYTALMYAANAAQEEVVRALVAAGAEVNARDRWGATALMFAAQSGSVRIVKRLLAAGADASARRIEDGRTALDVALSNGHERVASILRSVTGAA